MQITSKGQVTIPRNIREQMGFLPHTEVEFRMVRDQVVLVKTEKNENRRGKLLVGRMRGAATGRLSADEIMRLTRGEADD